jgi:hypothetical protein
MKFSLYNLNTKVDSTVLICLNDTTQQFNLVGSNGDTLFITITTVASEFNGKPHMLVQLYSRVGDRLAVSISANSGTVNMWQGIVIKTSGYYGSFTKSGYAWAVNGDNLMTCGDLVSTEQALAVAAYNSKPTFTNISGQSLTYQGYPKGAIASFSSKGPTADGRVKPDIAGPGLALASSVSAMDSSYLVGGADYSSVIATFVSPFNNETYSYAMAGGTSMSSPCVSGIVGMLLEIDSTLNPAAVKNLLFNTAIIDSKTGAIPDSGSTIWGHGKVNAYGAVASLLGLLPVSSNSVNLHCKIFPNPGKGQFSMEVISMVNELAEIKIYDSRGSMVKQVNNQITSGINVIDIDLSREAEGVYFLQVKGNQTFDVLKLIKQ